MAHEEIDLLRQAEAERLAAGYNWRQRAGEIAGITAFFAATPLLLLEIADHYQLHSESIPHERWWILAGFLAGWVFADWVSGLFHWAADNWGSAEWPVLGTHFIRPFRHHHIDPVAMTKHDFVETNGSNCIISLPAFAWGYWSLSSSSPTVGLFFAVFWLSVCYWVFGTNQFHAWAHTSNPPKVVRWLQRSRLILHPKHHARHHEAPHNRNYGITNGWTNPLMRALRFYEMIEWTVTKLTGIRPEHQKLADTLHQGAPQVAAYRPEGP